MNDQPASILIIEDDHPLSVALEDALTERGWHVSTARTGESGLAAAQQNHPNLILLDLMLDEMSGVDVLRQLRQDVAWGANVPIIILSNLSYIENLEEIKSLATAYIFKGDFELAALTDTIAQHIAADTKTTPPPAKP